MLKFALALALATPALAPVAAAPAQAPAPGHQALVTLFAEWRAFNHPTIVRGRPDYGAEAIARKEQGLAEFKQRLGAINTAGWSASQKGDYRVVEAEMNGLERC